MTNKVEIIVSAKDEASGPLKKVASSFSAISQQIVGLLGAGALETLGRAIVKFGTDAVNSTVKYANEIKKLSTVSGASMEDTSRLVQVLDDFRITTDQLTPALNAMRSQGLVPTIETLAKISDEYTAATSAAEANNIAQKNLGRGWQTFGGILSKGGDAIREMAASVDDSLIVTDAAYESIQEYQISVDNLSDSFQGFKMTVGKEVIPVLTTLMNAVEDADVAEKALNETGLTLAGTYVNGFTPATIAVRQAALDAAAAQREIASALREVDPAAQAAQAALEDMATNLSDMNFILSFQRQTEGFEESKEKLIAQADEIAAKIIELTEGGISKKEQPQLAELRGQMDDVNAELKQGEAAFKAWQRQAIFSLVQTKLAADGLDDIEFNQLLAFGESLGVIDPETAAAAQDILASIEDVDDASLAKVVKDWTALEKADHDLTFTVTYVTVGSVPTIPTSPGLPPNVTQASGGSFTVPSGFPNDSYMVGVTSGEQVSVSTPAQQSQGGSSGTQNFYLYGAKIMLERGQENNILATLTE